MMMRRLARHLFTLCSAVLIVLCTAVFTAATAGYVASYRSPWEWQWSSGHSDDSLNVLGAASERGHVIVGWRRTFYRPITAADTPRFMRWGIVYFGTRDAPNRVSYRLAATRPTLLCIAAGLGVPAALVATRWRRRTKRLRRIRAGSCPTCGYDLRACAGRCPECGAACRPLP